MKKSNQVQSVTATSPAIPKQVGVAMAEIGENMQEGLLALAVGAGLQVMQTRTSPRWPGPRASTTRTGPRCATGVNTAR